MFTDALLLVYDFESGLENLYQQNLKLKWSTLFSEIQVL